MITQSRRKWTNETRWISREETLVNAFKITNKADERHCSAGWYSSVVSSSIRQSFRRPFDRDEWDATVYVTRARLLDDRRAFLCCSTLAERRPPPHCNVVCTLEWHTQLVLCRTWTLRSAVMYVNWTSLRQSSLSCVCWCHVLLMQMNALAHYREIGMATSFSLVYESPSLLQRP